MTDDTLWLVLGRKTGTANPWHLWTECALEARAHKNAEVHRGEETGTEFIVVPGRYVEGSRVPVTDDPRVTGPIDATYTVKP